MVMVTENQRPHDLTHSEQINEIAIALVKAQAEMGNAVKSSYNPHFKVKYADLKSVKEVSKGPLIAHGLAVVQSPSWDGSSVHLTTLIVHTSGQWFRGTLSAKGAKEGVQQIGSVISYLRRYALEAFLNIVREDEDDDGETADGRGANDRKSDEERKGNDARPNPPRQASKPEKKTAILINLDNEKHTAWLAKAFDKRNVPTDQNLRRRLSQLLAGMELSPEAVDTVIGNEPYDCFEQPLPEEIF